jgi:hypothetical protein
MIQNRAMLVDLTISQWTATKHDKAVSTEVERNHAAKDAGRYNKRLVDKAHMEAITNAASQLRSSHYAKTLPWTDKGQRLLPSDLFMEYRQEIARLKAEFNNAVDTFVRAYPQLVQDARVRLGTMYNPDDYPSPSDIRRSFDVKLDITPVPDAADFRVDVATEAQEEIRKQITEAVEARQINAVKDCWVRVREVLTRIADQCGKEKGRIHDSLMDNAQALVGVLSALNITHDPELTAVEAELRSLIVTPDALRKNPAVRQRVAEGAADILARVQ